MNGIKELTRRSMYFEDEGMACGPVSVTAIDAEIAIVDNGKAVYLHAQWVDAAGDDILYEATTESIYNVYEIMNHATSENEMKAALAERDRIDQERIKDDARYESYYNELKKMIIDEMETHGICDYFDDEEEDE